MLRLDGAVVVLVTFSGDFALTSGRVLLHILLSYVVCIVVSILRLG